MTDPDDSRAFHPSKTHKASEASAILDHCLKQRGWTREYREGTLDDTRRIALLDDVRQYGRDWLRHEATRFFEEYGSEIDGDGNRSIRPGESSAEAERPDANVHATAGIELASAGRETGAHDGDSRAVAAAIKGHLGRFFGRAKLFVRELIVAGAMAMGGPQQLDADDLAETERQAQVQAAYFDRFRADVETGPPPEIAVVGAAPPEGATTAARFIARAEQYGNAAWAVQNGNRSKVLASGKAVRERRLHLRPDPSRHACPGCLTASERGWSNLGSLPDIGDCECLNSCDCYFIYELTDGSTFITAKGWTVPQVGPVESPA